MVIQALKDQGVEHIFGYPGGAVLPIYDELSSRTTSSTSWCATSRAPAMRPKAMPAPPASAAWRWSPPVPARPIWSPPLTDAMMDSIPMVCITGQVPTHLIGNDAFQECDTVGITRPCTKHNWLVRDVNDLPRVLHEAFYIATTGRPGPVVVDIPKDVQFATGTYRARNGVAHKSYKPAL
jgi:acetolactate synthase-1/2/3 large subunit